MENYSIGPEQFPKGKGQKVGKYIFTYQVRDWQIIDYKMWKPLPNFISFRGPAVDLSQPYVSFLGAAQTFGPYVEKPFPYLLQEKSKINSLNLGVGGASAAWYQHRKWFNHPKPPKLLNIINKSELCVLQIMSPKTTLIELDQNLTTIDASTSEYWKNVSPKKFYDKLKKAKEIWIEDYINLIDNIKVPVYLFDFSYRDFNFSEDLEGFQNKEGRFIDKVSGKFPQYVDHNMINAIKDKATGYYEYKQRIGLPQKLKDRFTGADHYRSIELPRLLRTGEGKQDFNPNNITNTQVYYPSPQMHYGAFEALIKSPFYKEKLRE